MNRHICRDLLYRARSEFDNIIIPYGGGFGIRFTNGIVPLQIRYKVGKAISKKINDEFVGSNSPFTGEVINVSVSSRIEEFVCSGELWHDGNNWRFEPNIIDDIGIKEEDVLVALDSLLSGHERTRQWAWDTIVNFVFDIFELFQEQCYKYCFGDNYVDSIVVIIKQCIGLFFSRLKPNIVDDVQFALINVDPMDCNFRLPTYLQFDSPIENKTACYSLYNYIVYMFLMDHSSIYRIRNLYFYDDSQCEVRSLIDFVTNCFFSGEKYK